MQELPIEPLASCLSLEPTDWINRCHEISTMAVKMGCIAGAPIYGNYYGPVGDNCEIEDWILRSQHRVPIRHGWIRQPGGVIIDPTRWVFEGVGPYVALILPGNAEHKDYDPGAQRLKIASYPPPPSRDNDKTIELMFDGSLTTWSKTMLQDDQGPPYTFKQIMWMANLPPSIAGIAAAPLYEALAGAGHRATIPPDYWDLVFPDYTEDEFGLSSEHKYLYSPHKCPKCKSTMDECFHEDCEVDVCTSCEDSLLCKEHICHEGEMHKCTYCLTVFCDDCDYSECPKCETPASRHSEL